MNNFFKIIFINIVIIFFLLITVEIVTRIVLHYYIGKSTAGLEERTQNLNYQPFVMYGPDWNKKFSNFKKDSDDLIILLIGGSTAAGFPKNILEEKINNNINKKVRILNASTGGYNATQSLLVLTIWGSKINPDIIISLDGGNDLINGLRSNKVGTFLLNNTYKLYLTKPYLSPFIWILQNSQFYNSLLRISARTKEYAIEDYYEVIDNYIEIQKNIKLFSNSLNSFYISILQPFSGFKNPKHEKENSFTLYKYRENVVKKLFMKTDIELDKLHKSSSNSSYINGSNLFLDDSRWIFSDDVHFIDEVGYDILANEIALIIKKFNIQ